VVPYTELSADALQGVVEAFVLREGTDYGATEYALGRKVAQVLATESVDIVPVRERAPGRLR
jgi:uncharacterized protein YheU (UPF0270 family)